jgi:hypothetical protein
MGYEIEGSVTLLCHLLVFVRFCWNGVGERNAFGFGSRCLHNSQMWRYYCDLCVLLVVLELALE